MVDDGIVVWVWNERDGKQPVDETMFPLSFDINRNLHVPRVIGLVSQLYAGFRVVNMPTSCDGVRGQIRDRRHFDVWKNSSLGFYRMLSFVPVFGRLADTLCALRPQPI